MSLCTGAISGVSVRRFLHVLMASSMLVSRPERSRYATTIESERDRPSMQCTSTRPPCSCAIHCRVNSKDYLRNPHTAGGIIIGDGAILHLLVRCLDKCQRLVDARRDVRTDLNQMLEARTTTVC